MAEIAAEGDIAVTLEQLGLQAEQQTEETARVK